MTTEARDPMVEPRPGMKLNLMRFARVIEWALCRPEFAVAGVPPDPWMDILECWADVKQGVEEALRFRKDGRRDATVPSDILMADWLDDLERELIARDMHRADREIPDMDVEGLIFTAVITQSSEKTRACIKQLRLLSLERRADA